MHKLFHNFYFIFFVLLLIPHTSFSSTNTATNSIRNLESTALSNSTTSGSNKPIIRNNAVVILEHADNAEYFRIDSINEDIIKIRGRAIITYKNDKLKADYITLNLKTKKIYGWGNVTMIQSDKTIVGDSFFFDMTESKGAVYKAATVIGTMIYSGAEIKNLDTGLYKVENGYFSTCSYRDPHYYLQVKKLWIYPDNSFLIFHLNYIVGGANLFYFPFAFRTEKGTGIISYGGYSSIKGYFIQNTYGIQVLRDLFRVQMRADYYQFKGFYGGTTIKFKDSDIALNFAIDRTLQSDGTYDNKFRWFNVGNINYSFSKPANTLTQIQGYYFNASDILFNNDFLGRSYKGGLSLNTLNLLQSGISSYNPYYYNQSAYYLSLSDSRGPSFLSVAGRINVQWNNAQNKFSINSIQIPDLRYRLSGTLLNLSDKSNSTFRDQVIRFFFKDIRWSANTSLNNILYYDVIDGKYQKSELDYGISADLSKSLALGTIFSYTPTITLGDIIKTGDHLTEDEIQNFKNASYIYMNYGENYRLNIHSILPKLPGLTTYLNVSRFISWQLTKSANFFSEYGNIKSYSISANYFLGYKDFTYNASVSANLLSKTNLPAKLSDPTIYNSLNQSASLKLFKSLYLQDTYAYSIRDALPIRNTATVSWSCNAIKLGDMSFSSAGFNTVFDQNFLNPLQDYIAANWNLSFEPLRFFRFNLSGTSRNNRLYAYSKNLLTKYNLDQNLYRDIWTDLANSFNFFNLEKRKDSFFKLQNISLYMNHNLHCWELSAGYTLLQQYTVIPYYNNVGYPYWEHRFWIQINLIGYDSLKYRKEDWTPPPVFENQ